MEKEARAKTRACFTSNVNANFKTNYHIGTQLTEKYV